MKFKFFFVITSFFRKLRAASEDNLSRKKAAEKAAKKLEERGKVGATTKIGCGKKKTAETSEYNCEQPKSDPVSSSIPIPSLKKKKAVVIKDPTPESTMGVGAMVGGGSSPMTLLQKAKSKRSTANGQQKNIFSSFHSDHESTTEAVLTEFIRHPRSGCVSLAFQFSHYYYLVIF